MKKSYKGIVTFAAITAIFVALIAVNYKSYISAFQTVLNKVQGNNDTEASEAISNTFKDNFAFRNKFIDLYGLSKKASCEDIIGNYEYVKDEAGIMQHIITPMTYENYVSSMKSLIDKLNELDISCIDVNIPDRGYNFSAADNLSYNGKRNDEVEAQLVEYGMDELNIKELMIDTGIISLEDYFFHTDCHLTTKAEFYMAKILTEHLSNKYGLEFPNTDEIYNLNNYDLSDHDFWGGFSGSCGKNYIAPDNFQTFIPRFDTQMRLTMPDGNVREGGFIDVMTNQYDSRSDSPYWVTNYGQWPTLYYEYDNLKYPDSPRLLVICDSMFMRSNTFLALNASHITVLDPRYIRGKEYIIDCLLKDSFDAAIICHIDYFNNNLFLSEPTVPEKILDSQTVPYNGMWLDYVNNNDLNNNNSTPGEIKKSYYANNEIVVFNGWAADFNANKPLSALYVKLGEKLVKCDYGSERTGVSDFFNNSDLTMTGFYVEIPKSYFDGLNELEFIQIGNDGTYRFEGVKYKLTDDAPNSDNINTIPEKTTERQFHDSENYMWIDYINGIDLNGEDSHQLEIKKSYFNDKNTVSFVGWAADFNVNKPLSALYIKLGERLVKCDYGIERSSVSDYYGNKDLRMTGFEIEVPSSYFEGLSEFEFVQVGYDGTYRFDNVKYEIVSE